MNEPITAWGIVRQLTWEDALRVVGVLVAATLRWAGDPLHPCPPTL